MRVRPRGPRIPIRKSTRQTHLRSDSAASLNSRDGHKDVNIAVYSGYGGGGGGGNGNGVDTKGSYVVVSTLPGLERTKKLEDAFSAVIHSKEYRSTLERFRYVYEFRRNIPLLLESGKFPRRLTGLAWAVYDSLDLYGSRLYRHLNLSGRTEVDHSFILSLTKAVDEVLRVPSTIGDFSRALARAGCDLETMSSAELRQHIARALDDYCLRGRANIENTVLAEHR